MKKELFESRETELVTKIKEMDKNFEILEEIERTGIEITSSIPQIIEKEVIKIENTGDYIHLQNRIANIPLEYIVYPFFTQSKKRRINLEYKFIDLGTEMNVRLPSGPIEGVNVKLPSTFEKEIYESIISMYQQAFEETGEYPEYIFLTPKDFIENYLNNKMNYNYYKRIEDALRNLKYTDYDFTRKNKRNSGNFTFEEKRFSLIDYEKGKVGRKIAYKIELDKNLLKKLKDKRYIKFRAEGIREISKKDEVALRIYEYISTIRYSKIKDIVRLETLCAVIPLKMIKKNKQKLKSGKIKEYITSNLSEPLKRVKKAFDILVELEYIESYKVVPRIENKSWNIEYVFSEKNICHTSSFLPHTTRKTSRKLFDLEEVNEESLKTNLEEKKKKINPVLLEKIENLKRYNIYFSKAYTKVAEKTLMELDLEVALAVLEKIKKGLKKNISSSLRLYIEKVTKEVKIELENKPLEVEIIKESEKNEKIEIDKDKDKDEFYLKRELELIQKMYSNFAEEKKEEIEKKALKLYLKDLNIEKLNPIQKKIFNGTVKLSYIKKVLI